MTKALELARECGIFFPATSTYRADQKSIGAFYAAAEAAGEKKAIDRLTAGVEVPFPFIKPVRLTDYDLFTHTQLLEYGAAQRLLGAREEREAADAMVGHYAEILASKREVKTMPEPKYILTQSQLENIYTMCRDDPYGIPAILRSLKPVEPIKNKTRDLIIHKAVTAYEIFDLIELHYFGELK